MKVRQGFLKALWTQNCPGPLAQRAASEKEEVIPFVSTKIIWDFYTNNVTKSSIIFNVK